MHERMKEKLIDNNQQKTCMESEREREKKKIQNSFKIK